MEPDIATLIFCVECKEATMVLLRHDALNRTQFLDDTLRDFVAKHPGHNVQIKSQHEMEYENREHTKKVS